MGQTSFGKYRLIAELGRGGMADVFLAVQAGPAGSRFRKLTVIKRLRQNLAEDPEFIAMLVDEARIAARLNHPNVVQTHEVGEVDDQYFISMEYLDGQPFHRIQHRANQRIKAGRDPVFTKDEQYVVLMDALAGLHHAHELTDFDGTSLEIVHRDVTPHNVFVTYGGHVKVVDFGIAKAAGRSTETRQGIVKGKVRYMAPEQAIGQRIDRRTDVFAAGIMLWEIAAGRRIWGDMDDFEIVQSLVSGTIPRSPREVDPTVPEAIDQICRRALAQRLDDRYPNAEEFRADLEQFLSKSGVLMTARRKMPASLNELFKDKRAEIKAVIEKQLADLDAESGELDALTSSTDSRSTVTTSGSVEMSQPAVQVLPTTTNAAPPQSLARPPTGSNTRPSATMSTKSSATMSAARSSITSTSATAVTAQRASVVTGPVAPPPPATATASSPAGSTHPVALATSPRSKRAIVAVVVAGAACGALIASLAIVGKVVTRPPPPPPPPEDIKLTLNVVGPAPNARVSIDDGPSEPLPLDRKVPKDNRDHRLQFEAEGYQPKTFAVSFTHNVKMTVDLPKIAPSATSDHAKPKPTTAQAPSSMRPAPTAGGKQ